MPRILYGTEKKRNTARKLTERTKDSFKKHSWVSKGFLSREYRGRVFRYAGQNSTVPY